jgi:hypothetical protein
MGDVYAPDKQRRSYVADRLGGKVTKEESNYRPHDSADTKDTCFECTHYLDVGEESSSCRRVAGIVYAEDTCDMWAARAEEKSEVQPQMNIHIEVGKD